MGMAIAVSRGEPASVPNVVPLIDVLSGADHNFHGDHAKGADWISDDDPSARATDEAGTAYPNTVIVQVRQGGKIMINRNQSDWNSHSSRERAKSRSQKWLAQLTSCAGRESSTAAWSRPAYFQTSSPPQGTVLALVVAWTIE